MDFFCKYARCFAALFIVLLLGVWPVYADNEPGERTERIDTLHEVVVMAPRVRFSVVSPIPSQTMRDEIIERLSSLSVADATRYFSGVQLKDYGGVGGLKTVNVRSLGSAHTAVFYDGVQLGNVQNGQVDLGKFSLQNVEEIQLFNGQKSSIFQPARGLLASSSLYLVTKQPVFENHAVKGGAEVQAGSSGLFNPSVYWAQKWNDAVSYSLNGEWQQANGKYTFTDSNGQYDTTATRQNSDIQALRLEAAVFGKLKNAGQWTLKGYFYDSERGLPASVRTNVYENHQRLWDRNVFLQASLQKQFGEKWETLFNVKYSNDYTRYLDPETVLVTGPLDNRYTQQEAYASGVAQFNALRWLHLSASADFVWNAMDANLPSFAYPTRYSFLGALSAHVLLPRFDLQASLAGASIVDETETGSSAANRTEWCPVVAASWQPFSYNGFRLRGLYKKTFRMPTFNDLYYTVVGNVSLKPEFTTQYDFGFTWNHNVGRVLQSIAAKLDAYYNQVDDKIVAMPSANLFRWTMMNIGRVEIKGVEASVESGWQIARRLIFYAGLNYTYQNAEDRTPGSKVYGRQIPYTPLHSGSATLGLNYGDWQLNYGFIYTGARYSLPANIPANYMEPWYTSDVALSWQHRLKKSFIQTVKISAEVNNLFDQRYDVVINFPMPGRSFRCGVAVGF